MGVQIAPGGWGYFLLRRARKEGSIHLEGVKRTSRNVASGIGGSPL